MFTKVTERKDSKVMTIRLRIKSLGKNHTHDIRKSIVSTRNERNI